MINLKKLVLATKNPGKVRELCEPLAQFGFDVQQLPDNFPDIEENGSTFEENALIKARAVSSMLGTAAAADDSGIEVDALDGAPGVFSSRYSDDWIENEGESRDERNNRKLLNALQGLPKEKRSARFRCCMAMVCPASEDKEGFEITVSGAWEGFIAEAPSGPNGFGYDPIFFDPELNKTGAELSREEKMKCSHRAKALSKLLKKLAEQN